ncbi:hypothetical protein RGQ13_15110 [Thalassotalea psychrophila]|uniref:SIR2-like domain-containing protein n=1 Tax=Thalassotalea psychrophila TaxID=3065647 RepID=A0ABY9TRU9_9GAMM|nr:hypothetical protein RGQ13_15110 [Colwelliaceae bacterium SQ149]
MDSELIDVSETAADVGYGFNTIGAPVFLTQKLWNLCVHWEQKNTDEQGFQEQNARLWDVLFICGTSLELNLQSFFNSMSHQYSILVIPRDGTSTAPVRAQLEASGNSEQGTLEIDLIDLVPNESEAW